MKTFSSICLQFYNFHENVSLHYRMLESLTNYNDMVFKMFNIFPIVNWTSKYIGPLILDVRRVLRRLTDILIDLYFNVSKTHDLSIAINDSVLKAR